MSQLQSELYGSADCVTSCHLIGAKHQCSDQLLGRTCISELTNCSGSGSWLEGGTVTVIAFSASQHIRPSGICSIYTTDNITITQKHSAFRETKIIPSKLTHDQQSKKQRYDAELWQFWKSKTIKATTTTLFKFAVNSPFLLKLHQAVIHHTKKTSRPQHANYQTQEHEAQSLPAEPRIWLLSRTSTSSSSRLWSINADRTVITFRALPSMVTSNMSLAAGTSKN